jgi:hypothetical protein
MAVFVLGDIVMQLVIGPVKVNSTALQASLTSAGAQLSRAASAVAAVTMGSGEADGPLGQAATLAQNASWVAPWGARASAGATLDAFTATFPAPALNNSALIAGGRAMAEVRAHPALPTVVIFASATASAAPPPSAADGAAPPGELSEGTILAVKLRVAKGSAEATRGLELSLGSAVKPAEPGGAEHVQWSEGALLYTLAPGLLTAPGTLQEALLPVVRQRVERHLQPAAATDPSGAPRSPRGAAARPGRTCACASLVATSGATRWVMWTATPLRLPSP